MLVGGVWFINRQLHGRDRLMTVAKWSSHGRGRAAGVIGARPRTLMLSPALLGGDRFAPFNRPIAKPFSATRQPSDQVDAGWTLMMLTSRGHLAAALTLRSITWPMPRCARPPPRPGRTRWQAHRAFYQRARWRFTVSEVVVPVFDAQPRPRIRAGQRSRPTCASTWRPSLGRASLHGCSSPSREAV